MSNMVNLNTRRKLVRRNRTSGSNLSLQGSLQIVSPPDLIQWLCCGNRSHRVHLWGADFEGELVVQSGELVDATAHGLRGMDALVAILEEKEGSFELLALDAVRSPSLHGSWQSLVLTATQRLDERAMEFSPRDRTREDIAPVPMEILTGNESGSVAELVDRGFVALRVGMPDEAYTLWTRALERDPDNRSIRFNLQRLEARALSNK
jgi:hypothetical protein